MNPKIVILGIFLGVLLITTLVEAKSVALIVKDKNNLSQQHEKRVFDALQAMGFNITLVDKTSNVTYTDFDLLVIAGRPGDLPTWQKLDDFVADLPVNDMPTVAIEPTFVDDWNWVKYGSASTLSSSRIQKIFIVDNNISITSNFTLGEEVVVHNVKGGNLVDIRNDLAALKIIAGVEALGMHGVIAVADVNTTLFNNTTAKERGVFFGITDTLYWTDKAEDLFKKSVEWVLFGVEFKEDALEEKNKTNQPEPQPVPSGGSNPPPKIVYEFPEGEVEVMSLPLTVEAETGKSTKVNFQIYNGLNADITDVKLAVRDSIPITWVTVVPKRFDVIKEGETKEVSVIFDIPADAEIYTYPLLLRIITHSKFGTFPYFEKFNVLLMESLETTTTTTVPTTTTTLPPEEKPSSGLAGYLVYVVSNPLLLTGLLVLIGMVFLVWKFYPRGYSKGIFSLSRSWKY